MGGFGGGNSNGGNGGRASNPNQRSGASEARSSKSKSNNDRGSNNPIVNYIKGGGIIGAAVRGLKKASKKSKQNAMDYEGQAAGVTPMRSPAASPRDGGGDNNNYSKTSTPQGIELAKQSTTSATILGPAEVQKEAANTIKGPTSPEMSAAQISVANKRKGRKVTNLTSKKTLDRNYTLSKKTLLGG
tara:strand:+ start:95 stop:655 length:561 start_codon:yes stop_codon:yes gene_type:complete